MLFAKQNTIAAPSLSEAATRWSVTGAPRSDPFRLTGSNVILEKGKQCEMKEIGKKRRAKDLGQPSVRS